MGKKNRNCKLCPGILLLNIKDSLDFYTKKMRPTSLKFRMYNRWTFAAVVAEIQAHLGIKLLMESGLSYLPQKEIKALKMTYQKLIEKSADDIKDSKLNKIVYDAVSALILNIYQISIISQTAKYFGKDIGLEDDIEKNWNLLASNWHNLDCIYQGALGSTSPGSRKTCVEDNSKDLISLLKKKNIMHSISGNDTQLTQISSNNFEMWFKKYLKNSEWLTKDENTKKTCKSKNTCFSNLHTYMKHFSMADWLGQAEK
ncbi:hypothetical protein BY996DRAFT_7024069 [Phakopsora pachyrhizi]|nr:hypothetical protein BY996DRAFT_7024069 [Phakopsora pachyrhizi]